MTELLLARLVRLVTGSIGYDVGVQDLSVSLRQLPALPRTGFVISGARPVG